MTMTVIAAIARDSGVDGDDGALVPWWSFTKTVLAAAALVLVSLGRLRLDEPVEGRDFTLRQLLGHRAGLRDYGPLAAYHAAVAAGEAPWPRAELLERVQADTLAFEPGGGWGYSNVGYMLVRELVEDAAGAPLRDALARLVFQPLGIIGARVASKPSDLDGTAWGNAVGYHPGWVYHGLLIGRAADAAMLLHSLLAGRLLPAPLLAAMRASYPVDGPIPDRPWRSASYGLGLMSGIGEPAGCYVGHTGAGPGSTAAIYRHFDDSEGWDRCTAAVFAPLEAPGTVERRAMALAHQG
ncbi:MAG: serine hydrolase domain-containing protein [Acetobacteraceae bacterium]